MTFAFLKKSIIPVGIGLFGLIKFSIHIFIEKGHCTYYSQVLLRYEHHPISMFGSSSHLLSISFASDFSQPHLRSTQNISLLKTPIRFYRRYCLQCSAIESVCINLNRLWFCFWHISREHANATEISPDHRADCTTEFPWHTVQFRIGYTALQPR